MSPVGFIVSGSSRQKKQMFWGLQWVEPGGGLWLPASWGFLTGFLSSGGTRTSRGTFLCFAHCWDLQGCQWKHWDLPCGVCKLPALLSGLWGSIAFPRTPLLWVWSVNQQQEHHMITLFFFKDFLNYYFIYLIVLGCAGSSLLLEFFL